jgi:hypothetical protein
MLHEHPLELADIKAGIHEQTVEPTVLKKRRAIYYPVAIILAIVLLGGIYAFVTMETTSITTVVPPPASNIPVYVPQTPTPLPTAAPTQTPAAPTGLTWNDFAGPLFQQKCATCHGAAAIAGLNLSTYADALKGSANGAVIVPKDSSNSKLILIQVAGKHGGQLSPDEIAQVKAWIDAGAPEK